MGAYKNSAVGDAVAKTAAPGAAVIASALGGKKPAAALPTMEQHADAIHPVPITPNRVTGKFSGE